MTDQPPLTVSVIVTPDGRLSIQSSAPNPIAVLDMLSAGMRAVLQDMAKKSEAEAPRVVAAPASALRILRPGEN